jgi:hypothetical protein
MQKVTIEVIVAPWCRALGIVEKRGELASLTAGSEREKEGEAPGWALVRTLQPRWNSI